MALRRWLLVGIVAAAGAAALPAVADAQPGLAIVTGQDAGWPEVTGWSAGGLRTSGVAPWGDFQTRFAAYPAYQQGVRVAVGDVNADGKPDIVTAPAGGWYTEIRAF